MEDIIFMLAGMAIIGLLTWQMHKMGVGPVPSSRATRKACLDMLAATQSAPPSHIVELGAGWGGMMASLSAAYPQSHVVGFERSILPYMVARARMLFNARATLHRTDIFAVGLTKADVVFCYLSPAHMRKLSPTLEAQMQKGARLISVSFPLPERTPVKSCTVPGIVDINIYLYEW